MPISFTFIGNLSNHHGKEIVQDWTQEGLMQTGLTEKQAFTLFVLMENGKKDSQGKKTVQKLILLLCELCFFPVK